MSKKVLITGATGFIGRTLLQELKKQEDIELIYCIDNLSNSRLDSLDPLFFSKNGVTHSRLFIEICSVNQFNPKHRFDEIYHLASPVGPVGVLKYAGIMGPMIVADTAKLAHIAIEHNAKLIDISTSEVYGKDPEGIPQKEDIPKYVPSNITVRLEYGVSKLLCEIFLTNLIKTTTLKCNIIRPYNIVSFGQQASAGFVLPRFIEQALLNKPLTVYKPGTQRRTFTDVRDFVNGMICIMEKGKNGEIYNLGNPSNLHSIYDLAMKVVDRLGSTIDIVDPTVEHGNLFAEAWEKIPCIDKVKNDTGWVPVYTLDDIVDRAVKLYTEK